jgi:hypothetical protein
MKQHSNLRGKFWNDREILHVVDFLPSGTFGAIREAETHLKELGYCTGSMCRQEPIGFAYGVDYVAKWYNLDSSDKALLDGVILPLHEFREGGATILFFTEPKY